MAGETNNLSRSIMTDTQTSKFQTSNDADGQIDAAITAPMDVAVDDTNLATISALDWRRHSGFFLVDDSPAPDGAITITVPAIPRGNVYFFNDTSFDAEIEISGQSADPVALASGSGSLVYSDGVNTRPASTDPSMLGTMASQDANAVAITGGTITGLGSPSGSSDAATKGYVDTEVSSGGLNGLTACGYATAAVLPNTPTYSNGTAGVGATLTAGSNAAIVVDGSFPSLGERVLVKDQVAPEENGVYTVTTVGSGAAAWVLTRATDFDSAGEMTKNSFAFISGGATLIGSSWLLNVNVTTVGTDPVDFVQFAGSSVATNIYYNSSYSGSVIVPNNPAASAAPPGVSVTIPASGAARTFAVNGFYQTNSDCAGTSAIWIVSDHSGGSAAIQGANNGYNTAGSAGADFGWAASIAGCIVTIPGDGNSHTLAVCVTQNGGGSGYTCTTAASGISAVQLP